MTKLVSILLVILFGRKDSAVAYQDPDPVMVELAEADRREAKAAKYFRKRRSR